MNCKINTLDDYKPDPNQIKTIVDTVRYMKSSDAKASKCHLIFSSLMMIFIKLVYLSSVISLK